MKSSEFSHKGENVEEIINTYKKRRVLDNTLIKSSYFSSAVTELNISYASIKENRFLRRAAIDTTVLDELKVYALKLGVDEIGFARVKPEMIFLGKEILCDNAIVLLMEMRRDEVDKAPSFETQEEINRVYYKLGKAVNALADFLRKKGYNVQAGPALNGDVNYPLLAESAGLGAIGKHGLLINPKFGPSVRIAVLFVDVKVLPVSEVNKHLWIKDFCKKCNSCVRKCPGDAIYKEPVILPDGSEQHIDYTKCAIPFSNNFDCAVCIKECTFYKRTYLEIESNLLEKNNCFS